MGKMKVFITKYALTQGIYEAEVEPPKHSADRVYAGPPQFQSFGPKEYSHHMPGAKALAAAMKSAKIASLKKQIKKLEALEF